MRKNHVALAFIICSMNSYAVKAIYPAEIMGRNLLIPGLGWIGHVGISTAPNLYEDAYQVIEVLRDETPVIQTNTIVSFKSRSPYWGSRYGISDRGNNALKILREANFQKDLFCSTYTATPDYMPGKGYYDNTGRAIPTSCGYFRCDTFINYIFNSGGYRLPTYNAPGPNVITSTLPKLVFNAFPYSNGNIRASNAVYLDHTHTDKSFKDLDFSSHQDFIAMPFDEFISIIDASTRDIKRSQHFLGLAQNKELDAQKREYLFDVLGFIANASAISELVNSYNNEQEYSIKKQLLATLQNIRQRLLAPEKDSPEKRLLHDFYQTILDRNLSPNEKEMALRGYIALSTNKEIMSNQIGLNEPALYANMHPRIALGLKLELLHKSSDLESALIPDIINFLNIQNNADLDEVFNVYLVNKFVYSGLDSLNPRSKEQIRNHLIATKHKYLPSSSRTTDKNMSIISHGAWLEAFALVQANSIDDAEKDVLRFLDVMDTYHHEKYVAGLSNRLSDAVSKNTHRTRNDQILTNCIN